MAPGTTVTFANTSGEPHLITGANASWGDRDAEIAAGASRSVTFDRAGIYPFSCSLHRGMTGVIVVGEPDLSDVAAASSTTTAGTDQAVVVAMSALGGLAVVGWAPTIPTLTASAPTPSAARTTSASSLRRTVASPSNAGAESPPLDAHPSGTG